MFFVEHGGSAAGGKSNQDESRHQRRNGNNAEHPRVCAGPSQDVRFTRRNHWIDGAVIGAVLRGLVRGVVR